MAEAEPRSISAAGPLREIEIGGAEELDAALRGATEPFVVRGMVADWPLVEAGRQSGKAARDYLLRFRRDVPFTVSVGEPSGDGRLFYDHTMGMNFRTARAKLEDVFARIDAEADNPKASSLYLASIDMHQFFAGLHEANQVDLGERSVLASIWMGTRTRIAAHNDFPQNLACVAAGRRRFTLLPPDQFRNLYLGPIDNTPAGRAISMVDFHHPDLDQHPRFAEAMRHALVAELEPGDAIHIPPMWWHHVEGLAPFNVLVNYWWRETPRWMGQPQEALNHAIMTIRDLPAHEKQHWRDVFDYYVFNNGDQTVGHIPEEGRSVLAPLTPESAGRIRAFLLRQLSR